MLTESVNSEHDNRLEFDITELQELARDTLYRSDCLFVLECCDSDFDGTAPTDIPDETGTTLEEERANSLMRMETMTAGVGGIDIDLGSENYVRRLARAMRQLKQPTTVESIAASIEAPDTYCEGYYRRDSGDESIVLWPLAAEETEAGGVESYA